jgi:hypothetical protein
MATSASETLASFSSQARGIMFYGTAYPGQHFRCCLEPFNYHDADCVALLVAPHQKLGHLAREAAHFLAPLLRAGFEAQG